MPVDLKKFQRIFLIHQKLRTKLHFDWQQLANACEIKFDVRVSQRTIEYDIDALKNTFHAPIKKRKGKYFYEDIPYSLFEVFDDSDYGSLNELLALLRQQKARKWIGLDEILIKLEQQVGIIGVEESTTIAFEKLPLKGIQHLEKLYSAIKENRTLKVVYEPYKSESFERMIKPILLKQFNNRWFLFAWEEGKEAIQNLPLDRIISFTFWHKGIKAKQVFDSKSYFEEVIGVRNEEVKIEKIIFKIAKNRAFYVQTKQIHHTQTTLAEDDSSITFQISVKPNKEMWAKMMELIEDLEIISPPEIREEMKSKIKKIWERLK